MLCAPPLRAAEGDDSFAEARRRFQDAPRMQEADHARSLELLVAGGHPEAVDAILSEIRARPTPGIWAYGIAALERLRDAGALARLQAAAREGPVPVRTAAVLAVRFQNTPGARAVLATGLLDPDPAVRTAAVHAAASSSRGPATLEALEEALEDPAWTVRAAAVAGLGRRTLDEAGGALVAHLQRETRVRIAEDAVAHLRRLSGQEFGRDPELWASWWTTRESPPRGEIRYGTPRYYGLPVVGDRSVFVLDASGSMDARAALTEEQIRRLELPAGEITKLELARAQLARALGELGKDRRFGIVTYSDTASPWKTVLDTATPDRTRAAVASLRSLRAAGGTNIYDSLVTGVLLGVKERFLEGLDEGPDQVLFLTDGIPSAGTFTQPSEIRLVLGLLCAVRRVRIDCVGIGRHDQAFLRALAVESGGEHIAVGQ